MTRLLRWLGLSSLQTAACVGSMVLSAQTSAHPDRQFYELGDFRLEGGQVLPGAKLAYATRGTLNRNRDNAILLPSAFVSGHHGYDFLLGPGSALDTTKYFVVLTELFGNGASSSPSNTPPPFDGPRFPPVAIRDNVAATHRLLTSKLGITHLKAIVGFSMGAQQALQWAVSHPEFIDAVVPYCGTGKTYPHGAVRLESAISALTTDSAFEAGSYTAPLTKGMAAWMLHWAAWMYSQEWWRRELFRPPYPNADSLQADLLGIFSGLDPNDMISQARSWQRHDVGDTPGFGGDHEAALRSIRARVLYLSCSTDLYFPQGEIAYESRFIPRVRVVPIRSLWGHMAGAGWNAEDNLFINTTIRRFLGSTRPPT